MTIKEKEENKGRKHKKGDPIINLAMQTNKQQMTKKANKHYQLQSLYFHIQIKHAHWRQDRHFAL